jgi:hypothetical protein
MSDPFCEDFLSDDDDNNLNPFFNNYLQYSTTKRQQPTRIAPPNDGKDELISDLYKKLAKLEEKVKTLEDKLHIVQNEQKRTIQSFN